MLFTNEDDIFAFLLLFFKSFFFFFTLGSLFVFLLVHFDSAEMIVLLLHEVNISDKFLLILVGFSIFIEFLSSIVSLLSQVSECLLVIKSDLF
jgi:hypothetical protein